MEKKELLDALNGLLGRYEQHRHYIDKAKAQAATGKFNSAVIEKVILDHEIKSSDVADEVGPLLPKLRDIVAGLEAEKTRINSTRGGVDEQIQEWELRCLIGEVTQDEVDSAVGELRQSQDVVNNRVSAIDADASEIHVALDKWASMAGPAGHFQASAPAPAPAPVVEVEEPEATADNLDMVDVGDAVGAHSSHSGIKEDVSPVFGAGNASAAVRVEEDIAIEAAEVNEDLADGPSADVQFGFDDDLLGAQANAGEVEIDLAGDAPAPAKPEPAVSKATVTAGPAAPAQTPTAATGDEAPRRALLLYQEGTAEEQIYPFTGDCLTIGRGRENDIQIKNDSKVSRYHCRISRRGSNFYIEDVKSSNGTLVNGELITERRLFGGEEVIIGETFFRFRIME